MIQFDAKPNFALPPRDDSWRRPQVEQAIVTKSTFAGVAVWPARRLNAMVDASRIPRGPFMCSVGWSTRACVVMVAEGLLALTVPFAVSAQDQAADGVAAAEPNRPAAAADSANAAETSAGERERGQSAGAEGGAANAAAAIKPESPEPRQVCRKIAVTGTRFTKRECRTVEEWKTVQSEQASQGRRLTRDIQGQTTVTPPAGPGQDTAQGRPSGLPNPGGL